MKKTIIAVAIAAASLGAFACEGNGCSSTSFVSGAGFIAGGANNSVSAMSAVRGTGSSESSASSSALSAAGLQIGVNATAGHGQAASSGAVESYTVNAASASAMTSNHGWGATGSADARAEAGSIAGYVVKGGAAAGQGRDVSVAGFQFSGVEGSRVSVAADADHIVTRHGAYDTGGAASAFAGTVINAIGGVEVKNCNDVASVSGFYSDAKLAETEVRSVGSAGGIAVAGGVAQGSYAGFVTVSANAYDRGHDAPGKPDNKHDNNGWGNGDQNAPGNSEDHNNAENNHNGKNDPSHGRNR